MSRFPLFTGRIGGGAIWSLLDGVVAQALTLLVFVANTHFLPPNAFGALATAIVLVELVRQLVFFPVAKSIISQKTVSDSDYTVALVVNITVSMSISALLFVLAPLLDKVFVGAELSTLVPFMAASTTIIGISTVYDNILVRKLEFRSLAIRSIVSVSIGGAIGLYLAINGYGIWSLVWQQILQQGIALAAVVSLSRWRPTLTFSGKDFSRITKFAAHISLNGLISFIGYQADTVTVAYFLGPTSTGLFNSAKRIGTALNQVVLRPLERVALPALVQFSNDLSRLKYAYLRALGVTALGTAPVFIGVAVISDDIVTVLLGPKWGGVAPVLSALSISFFGSTVMQYNSAVILVARQPKLQSIFNSIFVVFSLALMLISVRYGIIGVAVGVVVRSALMLPIQTRLTAGIINCSTKEICSALAPAVSAAIVMGLALAVVSKTMSFYSPIAAVALKITIGGIAYVAVLLSLFREKVYRMIKGG